MDFPTKYGFFRLKFSPTNQSIAFYICFFFRGYDRFGNSWGILMEFDASGCWSLQKVGRFPLLKTKLGAEKELRRDRSLAPVTIQWRSGLVFFGFGMTFSHHSKEKTPPKRNHGLVTLVGNFHRKNEDHAIFGCLILGWWDDYLWQSNIVSTGQRHQSGISYGHVWFVMW